MRSMFFTACLLLVGAPAFAQKDCEELKSEIAQKLDAKGVKNYELRSVPTEEVADQKVIGSCAGGSMKIVYKRS